MPLNVAVLIKQVPDMNAVKIDRATGKPVFGGQLTVSSYDEYAVEEALRLKEAHGGEVTVVAAGPPSAKDALTRALAMGADRAVLIDAPNVNQLDTLSVARMLASRLRGQGFDLILAGQTADDNETGQVGAQLAELLDAPLISNAIGLEVAGDQLVVQRDTEDGQQTVETGMPAVLLASTGLNTPRYPSLKGIMAAKRKPLEMVPAEVETGDARISWGEPYSPERTTAGVILQDVPPAEAARQLVGWIKEQKLI
jgi:electron transfer flavoprotein beta subunit